MVSFSAAGDFFLGGGGGGEVGTDSYQRRQHPESLSVSLLKIPDDPVILQFPYNFENLVILQEN